MFNVSGSEILNSGSEGHVVGLSEMLNVSAREIFVVGRSEILVVRCCEPI